jgi:acyl-CoA reductase-like NAD-dependent aldehyde dehydrogenase
MTETNPQPAPLLVAGRWEHEGTPLTARSPGDGRIVGHTFEATAKQLDEATDAAVSAFQVTRRLASFERSEILRRAAELISGDVEGLATTLAAEIGKPINDSRLEVRRTAACFRMAAEEAERIGGEVMPLDLLPTARGRWGITRKMPIGPIAAITPFNVPLSLSAHKVAPALAAGCTVVLKPDSRAALTMLRLATLLVEAGVPEGALSVLPMSTDVGDRMVTDHRFRMVSFTGSVRAGWDIRSRAGTKKVTLELGGTAPVIVDETADVAYAATRTVAGAFKYAGQLCISVQRALVHRAVWDEYLDGLVKGAGALVVGDPLDEQTQVGPMISVSAADRIRSWVDEALASGARVVAGGEPSDPGGAYVAPLVMEQVPDDARLATEEAFGPIVTVTPFEDIEEAFAIADSTPFGLQAGYFTRDLNRTWRAFESLEFGAIVVNDVPAFRVDNMPFGGVKNSGLGREGVRWAIDDMTDPRLLVIAPEAG